MYIHHLLSASALLRVIVRSDNDANNIVKMLYLDNDGRNDNKGIILKLIVDICIDNIAMDLLRKAKTSCFHVKGTLCLGSDELAA